MKLNLTFVCLTALTLAACSGSGNSTNADTNPDDETEPGDDEDLTSSGDGDGDSAGDGDGDSVGDGDGDGDEPIVEQPAAPDVEVEVKAGIPGKETALTASSDEGATFQWTLVDAPAGSDLDNEDLEGADTDTVTFVGQRSGTYELSVEVTVNGETTEKSVSFQITGYDVPFSALTVLPADGPSATAHLAQVINSGGGDPIAIGCSWEATSDLEGAEDVVNRHRGTTVRMPKEVGEPALALSRIYAEDGNHLRLEVANSTSHCEDAPPAVLNTGDLPPSGYMPLRISPNGERFMGTSVLGEDYIIYTWGLEEGEVAQIIASGEPTGPTQVAWKDDTHIAAMTGVSDGEDGYIYAMYEAPDQDGGASESEKIMDCDGVAEGKSILPSNQFMFRGTDLYLLASPGIYRLEAEEGIYDCDIDSELNTLLTGEHLPGQFDVADDGSTLVFMEHDASAIFSGPTDGETEATRISPLDGTQHRFPLFALGGEQIVWNSTYIYELPPKGETTFAEGDVTRILRANPDGSHRFVIYSEEVLPEQTAEATFGNQVGSNCSFGLPLSGGPAGAAALSLGLLAALRRRQLRRSVKS